MDIETRKLLKVWGGLVVALMAVLAMPSCSASSTQPNQGHDSMSSSPGAENPDSNAVTNHNKN